MKPSQYFLIGHIPFSLELCQLFNLDIQSLENQKDWELREEKRLGEKIKNFRSLSEKDSVTDVVDGLNNAQRTTKSEGDLPPPDGTWRTVRNYVLPATTKSILEN